MSFKIVFLTYMLVSTNALFAMQKSTTLERLSVLQNNTQTSPQSTEECPLIDAAFNGELERCTELLKNSVTDINAQNNDGKTALMFAARNGHKEVVQLLLAHQGIAINAQDSNGYTALMLAAKNGHKEVVQLLLAPTRNCYQCTG